MRNALKHTKYAHVDLFSLMMKTVTRGTGFSVVQNNCYSTERYLIHMLNHTVDFIHLAQLVKILEKEWKLFSKRDLHCSVCFVCVCFILSLHICQNKYQQTCKSFHVSDKKYDTDELLKE